MRIQAHTPLLQNETLAAVKTLLLSVAKGNRTLTQRKISSPREISFKPSRYKSLIEFI